MLSETIGECSNSGRDYFLCISTDSMTRILRISEESLGLGVGVCSYSKALVEMFLVFVVIEFFTGDGEFTWMFW